MSPRSLLLLFLCMLVAAADASGGQGSAPILYPKKNALVGSRVNLVLDPSADWSAIRFFQVIVGATEYRVVDTSTMKHAVQGIRLEPGLNTITVKLFEAWSKKKKKQKLRAIVTVPVYSKNDIVTGGAIPRPFSPRPFHSRKNEQPCSGCHRLNVQPSDFEQGKPEDMMCYACHRGIPTGEHIHGPAAIWDCLTCHNPELYPVKYQFLPVTASQRTRKTATGKYKIITVAESCKKCHHAILSGSYTHGPADAGYCTLCHDPHASPNPAWLKKGPWDLCVTCHATMAAGRHVVAGFVSGKGHPTKKRKDRSRPGKRLSCASCHEPHSAESEHLFAHDIKTRYELCRICHAKK